MPWLLAGAKTPPVNVAALRHAARLDVVVPSVPTARVPEGPRSTVVIATDARRRV